MTDMKVVETPKVMQVYERGCDVLLEQLNALRGAVNPATIQPSLQIIEVTGRLVHSLYPIIESIQDKSEEINNADNQKDNPEV